MQFPVAASSARLLLGRVSQRSSRKSRHYSTFKSAEATMPYVEATKVRMRKCLDAIQRPDIAERAAWTSFEPAPEFCSPAKVRQGFSKIESSGVIGSVLERPDFASKVWAASASADPVRFMTKTVLEDDWIAPSTEIGRMGPRICSFLGNYAKALQQHRASSRTASVAEEAKISFALISPMLEILGNEVSALGDKEMEARSPRYTVTEVTSAVRASPLNELFDSVVVQEGPASFSRQEAADLQSDILINVNLGTVIASNREALQLTGAQPAFSIYTAPLFRRFATPLVMNYFNMDLEVENEITIALKNNRFHAAHALTTKAADTRRCAPIFVIFMFGQKAVLLKCGQTATQIERFINWLESPNIGQAVLPYWSPVQYAEYDLNYPEHMALMLKQLLGWRGASKEIHLGNPLHVVSGRREDSASLPLSVKAPDAPTSGIRQLWSNIF